MSYVFDTSSLMAVLLDQDSPDIDVLFDEHTVELTFYEAGNVLWKVAPLQERLEADETHRLVGTLEDLRLELVVHELSELGIDTALEMGSDCDITFYDAVHVACAKRLNATLVTEDGELRDAAGKIVEVCGLDELG